MTYASPEVAPAEDSEQTGLIVPGLLEFRCLCGKISNILIGRYREREKELLAQLTLAQIVEGHYCAPVKKWKEYPVVECQLCNSDMYDADKAKDILGIKRK